MEYKPRVTGENSFVILKAIKKMGIMQELVELIKKMINKEDSHNQVLAKLQGKSKEEITDIFKEDNELLIQYNTSSLENADIALDILLLILDNVDKAEKEIFNALAKVYEKDVNVIKNEDFDVLTERISGIVRSESFGRFFSSINKLNQ